MVAAAAEVRWLGEDYALNGTPDFCDSINHGRNRSHVATSNTR
jgi:hypothetical protein